jgi:predicted transcriptional regulator
MSEKQTSINEFYALNIQDYMQPFTSTDSYVEKTDEIDHVFHLLSQRHHVWVIDQKSTMQVLGIITESDTIQLFAPAYTPLQSFDKPTLQSFQFGLSINAQEIMSAQPITAKQDDTLGDVIIKMKQHKIKQLAVIDTDDRLIGELTLHHLISEYSKKQKNLTHKKNTITSEKNALTDTE